MMTDVHHNNTNTPQIRGFVDQTRALGHITSVDYIRNNDAITILVTSSDNYYASRGCTIYVLCNILFCLGVLNGTRAWSTSSHVCVLFTFSIAKQN